MRQVNGEIFYGEPFIYLFVYFSTHICIFLLYLYLREQRGSEHALVNTNMLKGALSDLKQFLVTGSPLKFMKNAFYFTLKALFVVMMFKPIFWSCRKLRLTSKFITSKSGKETITIHVLHNISRSKSNQTIKFGQLFPNRFLKIQI